MNNFDKYLVDSDPTKILRFQELNLDPKTHICIFNEYSHQSFYKVTDGHTADEVAQAFVDDKLLYPRHKAYGIKRIASNVYRVHAYTYDELAEQVNESSEPHRVAAEITVANLPSLSVPGDFEDYLNSLQQAGAKIHVPVSLFIACTI